jgi:hypothetical protein
MSGRSKWDYFKAIYARYQQAPKAMKAMILDEFCRVCGYHRKYAIRKLAGPPPKHTPPRRHRRKPVAYSATMVGILQAVWEAAGYPWSVRLKAVVVDWMPWIHTRFALSADLERQLRAISARQIDRRLGPRKRRLKTRLYGRTKPGTLLKHQIPIRTDHWDVTTPGFTEVDTVSHSGNSGDGLFAYTVNQTDIHTTWVESRAVLGKGEAGVVAALDGMAQALPFVLKGLDSDNGSEFINWHLLRYCQRHHIQPSRSRPYKKDDNAHIEQKNWTHVRKLVGWDRYDTPAAVAALNDLYQNELRLYVNLFLPSVKLKGKHRVGSKLIRRYEAPKTPWQRVLDSGLGDPQKIAALQQVRATLDPFTLSTTIEHKLETIWAMANRRHRPTAQPQNEINRPHARLEAAPPGRSS